jgi:replicative DNA helicase
MSDVERGLQFAADEWGMRPGLIALDYLQRIRPEGGGSEHRHQLSLVTERVKDLALAMGCPILLGSQAGRQVMQRKVKIPLIEDAKETGNIEETADALLSVFMPKTGEVLHSLLPMEYGLRPRYGDIVITEDLLTITVGKRRGGRAGDTFAYRVAPEHNRIEEYV